MRFPYELVLRPSRCLMVGIAVGHGFLLLAFASSSLPLIARVVGCGAVAASLLASWRTQRATKRFLLTPEGFWGLRRKGGESYDAVVIAGCRDLGWALWLAWRPGDSDQRIHSGRCRQMVARDAVTPEAWRHLRAWLRFKAVWRPVPNVPADSGS